jgi:hypothetical protein
MKKTGIQASAVVILCLASACSSMTPSTSADCAENLGKRRDRAGLRAIDELDGIGDTLEGALDVQKRGRVDERAVAQALERIRNLDEDLISNFGVACE